jgi:hypothetical protein
MENNLNDRTTKEESMLTGMFADHLKSTREHIMH